LTATLAISSSQGTKEEEWNVPAERLPFTPEVMMFNRFILLGSEPAYPLGILIPNTFAPGEFIVNLDEVVIPHHRIFRPNPAEEVRHAFFQLLLKPTASHRQHQVHISPTIDKE
jgi:hypothetical protein